MQNKILRLFSKLIFKDKVFFRIMGECCVICKNAFHIKVKVCLDLSYFTMFGLKKLPKNQKLGRKV